jgi:guanylate kinase
MAAEREEHYKTYNPEREYFFGTIAQIQEWMKENNVPEYAQVVYNGCGTHQIGFEWYTVKEREPIDEHR